MKKLITGIIISAVFFTFSACTSSREKASETPVDCPLNKQGINATHEKPFRDTAKYIEFLERPDRSEWQKPDLVVSAMNLTGHEVIADLGAGSGYFSFRFAKALSKGKVIAIDTDHDMLRYIHHKSITDNVKNINVSPASFDDPKIPADVNVIFICDVLHHVKNRSEWLKRLYGQIRENTRIVLIEFREGDIPKGPPASIKISSREIISLMEKAGFHLVKQDMKLLPYQNYFEFRKK